MIRPSALLACLSFCASPAILLAQDEPRLRPVPDPVIPSGSPVILSRQSATTTVLSGDDLRSLGIRFLSDGFRVAPGLEVTRMSSTEANVSLRGYNDDTSASQGVMGLLDGRQVYNEFLGNVVWEALPVSIYEIERIEILRGPGSFLYGPNAMHGLVNFVTRSPMDYFSADDRQPQEVWLCVEAGSYRSNTETLIYVHREGNIALRVKVSHDDINEFEPATQDAKNKVFGEAKVEAWLDGSNHRVEGTVGYSRQSFNVLIPTFSVVLPANFDNFATEPYAKINYTLDALRAQASWTRFDAVGNPERSYSPFHVISDTADLDVSWTQSPIQDHRVTLGGGFRYSTFTTEHPDVSDGRHQTLLGWIFAQDEWTLVPNLYLTGGVRIDRHSRAGTSTSPRAALVWQFVPDTEDPKTGERTYGQSIRLTGGYGFRNPSLRELWFNMPVDVPNPAPPPTFFPGRILGNPDLRSEQMRSFELGYWGRPHKRLQIELNLYYNLIDHLVQFEAVGPTDFGPRNVNQDRAYGGELEIEYQIDTSVFAFANYAYAIRQDRDTGVRNPSAPRHKVNGGVRVGEGKTGINSMLWVTFVDDVVYQDPLGGLIGEVKAYAMLNARIAYGFTAGKADAKIYLQAFNLLDHDHREHAEGQSYGILAMAGFEVAW